MKRILSLCLVTALSIPLAGCFIVTRSPSRQASRSHPQCHPSQYWDGNQCVHKGRGHGARKHDGR